MCLAACHLHIDEGQCNRFLYQILCNLIFSSIFYSHKHELNIPEDFKKCFLNYPEGLFLEKYCMFFYHSVNIFAIVHPIVVCIYKTNFYV